MLISSTYVRQPHTVRPRHGTTKQWGSHQNSKVMAQKHSTEYDEFAIMSCFVVFIKPVKCSNSWKVSWFQLFTQFPGGVVLKNESSCALLFPSAIRKQQHISVFTTQPPPWDIFSRYLKKKTLWPWWTLWCPVSLILLTGQQASKPGLFSHQTNAHNWTFSSVDVERCMSKWNVFLCVWLFQQCANNCTLNIFLD